ncbi:MAG: T9SS type A sorting domain-containing protein [Porphyromonadaceae bacterium]|nr:T9SS type A sorting domain-containing protein [Porphyromonadaceae bacterium]
MKNTFFFILAFLLFSLNSYSQKLNGTNIGSTPNFDYGTNKCSPTANTAANVFDGDFNTYLAGCERNNVWAGLDLGEPHVITEIAYCPRETQENRLILGVFEGANSPDFGDAIPIFMITERPDFNKLTRQSIQNSRAFRYVRYVGPNDTRGNIAEVEFYGHKATGNDTKLFQVTNIPSIIIHTTNAQDIKRKDEYVKGIISVISEDGTKFYTDSLKIRGRGNASWLFPKKPYRLKLFHKTNLLGLPARQRNWTLINNYGDKTLMRNLLAFDLSKRFEMPYTPAGVPVDVFLNGEYKGNYQLCDQVEVNPNRVPVEKMDSSTSTLPYLSGGYFIEIDAYADKEDSWFTSKQKYIPVTVKYPKDDEITYTQFEYIRNHFNEMEASVFSYNYTHPTLGFRKYLDTESFLRHFLVGEISGNTDTYWSVFMYKFQNLTNDPAKDKFYFSPVWDFDLAYENDRRTNPINEQSDWLYKTKGSNVRGGKEWANRIFTDPGINNDLKRIYKDYRDRNIISESSLLSVVDSLANEIYASQKLNFTRWPILSSIVHQNFQALGSYDAEVETIRTYIKDRIKWVDNKLGYVPNGLKDSSSPDIKYWSNSDIFHITGFNFNSIIEIYDISGRSLVINRHVKNEFSIQLDKGIYLIKIKDNNNKMESLIKYVME